MVRAGVVYAARLRPAAGSAALQLPAGNWRLAAGGGGTLEDLVLQSCPHAELAAGQVRVAVAAVGVNFRDVLVALGMYPGGGELGVEGAGMVIEVGPGVAGLAVGDRGDGSTGGGRLRSGGGRAAGHRGAGGVVVATGRGCVGGVSDGVCTGCRCWRACKPGEKVLVHAATGGVGMAAVAVGSVLGGGGFCHRQSW